MATTEYRSVSNGRERDPMKMESRSLKQSDNLPLRLTIASLGSVLDGCWRFSMEARLNMIAYHWERRICDSENALLFPILALPARIMLANYSNSFICGWHALRNR